MGKNFIDHDVVFQEWFEYGDQICKNSTGRSIINTLFSKSIHESQDLVDILITHPAIYIFGYSLYKSLESQGVIPSSILGVSLGEFTGMAVSEVFSFETGLEIVIEQAKLMNSLCNAGRMLVILDDHKSYLSLIHSLDLEISAYNFDKSFAVSGSVDSIKELSVLLKKRNVIFQSLAVNQAYHSREMDKIKNSLKLFFASYIFNPPKIPIISCANDTSASNYDFEYFWNIIRKPIRFMDAIKKVRLSEHIHIMDLSATGTLANLVKYNLDSRINVDGLSYLLPGKGFVNKGFLS